MKRGKTNGDKGVDVVQQGGTPEQEREKSLRDAFGKATIKGKDGRPNNNALSEFQDILPLLKTVNNHDAFVKIMRKNSEGVSVSINSDDYCQKMLHLPKGTVLWGVLNKILKGQTGTTPVPGKQQQHQQQQQQPPKDAQKEVEVKAAESAFNTFTKGPRKKFNILINIDASMASKHSIAVAVIQNILSKLYPSNETGKNNNLMEAVQTAQEAVDKAQLEVNEAKEEDAQGKKNVLQTAKETLQTAKNALVAKPVPKTVAKPEAKPAAKTAGIVGGSVEENIVYYTSQSKAVIEAASFPKGVDLKQKIIYNFDEINPNTTIHIIISLCDIGKFNTKVYNLPYLLYLENVSKADKSTEKPFILERYGDATYNGYRFDNLKNIISADDEKLIKEVKQIITTFNTLKGNKSNNVERRKHDENVVNIVTELSKNEHIDTNSIGFLLSKYKFNVKLTEQEENREKQEFTISEFAIKLRTQIKKAEVVDMFESFIINENDPKADEKNKLLSDVYQIPNNINLLVMTDFLAYDILSVLLLLLQPRKISKVYIPKSAYNIENFAKLQMGSVVEFITFDNVYELMYQDVNINLVSYLTPNENKRELSHFMMSQKLIKKSPGYFYLDENKLAKFLILYADFGKYTLEICLC